MKNNVRLSLGEEIGNSVTHGVMSGLLLLFLPYASVRGYMNGGLILSIGYSVFIISLFLMFLASTLYHAMAYDTKHKYVFRILDHIGIYLAIAGTYTPVCLYTIGGTLGYTILFLQWLMVLVGILYKSIAQKSIPKVSVTIYLVMGWTAVVLLPQMIRTGNWVFMTLIALGGILYSIGTYFYMQKDKPYFHMIWHIFINLAAISHFIAIIFFIQ
ncbi:hemolysin III [Erysipelothrix larvae]|uniref:Hemolysin III n=2 Tax=Erysipelothrix larvae TaxID=1514105 RepID=A0A120JU19_9FIRM|nr:hemolysin III [Erysipelothrix larvae]